MAQAAAMANHDPTLWTQNSEVICNGFGVRRANADIHHGDALTIFAAQVIGWHLEAAPRRVLDFLHRVFCVGENFYAARGRQAFIFVVFLETLYGPFGKGVDIAVIVGEKHIALEVLERRAGIVLQTLE